MVYHKPEHKKVWWWVAWPFMATGFVLMLPYGLITGREPMEKKPNKTQWKSEWYQSWEDYIDDPIDWLKYKLFGIGTLP